MTHFFLRVFVASVAVTAGFATGYVAVLQRAERKDRRGRDAYIHLLDVYGDERRIHLP